ncbi:unnamed protein product [Parascedosporium putredinis]|uniref:Uncharacterized protein n=1 Tax=Parascedosporium putredinis TaxID=1442378 RepID=A0A9P1MG95_9PEZI|nr:unnamed protein product [Parascedosporium putredinis]CAI8004019.1 unnamed protein product [Parascedosporium putredinis]
MKFSIYALLLSAVSAAAAPLDVTDEIAVKGPIAPLEWTGQVEVGGDIITLTGSAEEIYNQIIAINPNYDDELGVKDWKQMSRRAVSQVQKRGDPINTASLNCDVGSSADPLFVLTGIDYLYGIGNGDAGPRPVGVAAAGPVAHGVLPSISATIVPCRSRFLVNMWPTMRLGFTTTASIGFTIPGSSPYQW